MKVIKIKGINSWKILYRGIRVGYISQTDIGDYAVKSYIPVRDERNPYFSTVCETAEEAFKTFAENVWNKHLLLCKSAPTIELKKSFFARP